MTTIFILLYRTSGSGYMCYIVNSTSQPSGCRLRKICNFPRNTYIPFDNVCWLKQYYRRNRLRDALDGTDVEPHDGPRTLLPVSYQFTFAIRGALFGARDLEPVMLVAQDVAS